MSMNPHPPRQSEVELPFIEPQGTTTADQAQGLDSMLSARLLCGGYSHEAGSAPNRRRGAAAQGGARLESPSRETDSGYGVSKPPWFRPTRQGRPRSVSKVRLAESSKHSNRGFHLSSFRLHVSTFCRILFMVSVSKTAQVELKSGRSKRRGIVQQSTCTPRGRSFIYFMTRGDFHIHT